jgi:RNA polymerase primary sigma factor
VHIIEALNQYYSQINHLIGKYGRRLTIDEISKEINIPKTKVRKILGIKRIISLETPIKDGESDCNSISIFFKSNEKDPYEHASEGSDNKLLSNVLEKLPVVEEEIIRMKFGIGSERHEEDEIAYKKDLTVRNVNEIVNRAISLLRKPYIFKQLQDLKNNN